MMGLIHYPAVVYGTWGVVFEAVLPRPSLPWSPSPKDQTVPPSADTTSVWFRPHATCTANTHKAVLGESTALAPDR